MLGLLAAGILICQSLCFAQPSMDTKVSADPGTAAEQPAAEKTTAKASDDKKTSALEGRYMRLLYANGYAYYLDTKSAHWVIYPHTRDKMLDIWVKLVDMNDASGSASDNQGYSYSNHYFLEHYYVLPGKEKIQFLSELEVTGRPSNAISERPYSSAHWESLVPGSIEDEIYRAVMVHIEEIPKPEEDKGLSQVGNAIEDIFRISL